MRGMIAELASPHPLTDTLPSMLREDPFARSLCESFDDVLAPVLLTLDTFDNYLDPGHHAGGHDPLARPVAGARCRPERRPGAAAGRAADRAVSLNVTRGTRRSIELVLENGARHAGRGLRVRRGTLDAEPGRVAARRARRDITVVVRPRAGVTVDIDRLDALVRSVKPAHVRHVVSVQPG